MKQHRSAYIIITLVSFMTHGLLLLNQGIYMDDWLTFSHLFAGDLDYVHLQFDQGGVSLFGDIWELYSHFSNVSSAMSITVFLTIWFGGILIYRIAINTKILKKWECLFIAIITIMYPAYQAQVINLVGVYHILIFLFLISTWLYLRNTNANKFFRIGIHLITLILFGLSFNLNSLLIFYGGVLLISLGLELNRNSQRKIQTIMKWLFQNLAYILVPVVFWITKEIFSPRYGSYIQYNQFSLDVESIRNASYIFLKNAIAYPFIKAPIIWIEYGIQLVIPIVLVVASLVLYKYMVSRTLWEERLVERIKDRHISTRSQLDDSVNVLWLLTFGIILLILAIAPYIIVGRYPGYRYGASTRHSILIGIPIAIILLGVFRLYISNRRLWLVKLGSIGLVICITGFGIMQINQYLSWEAIHTKDTAIMQILPNTPFITDMSILWLKDGFTSFHHEFESIRRGYESLGMYKILFNEVTLITYRFEAVPFDCPDCYINVRHFPDANINWAGCNGELHISASEEWKGKSEQDIAWYHLYVRFIRPDLKTEFYDSLVDINIIPIRSPKDSDCHLYQHSTSMP
jgi:hypothetical protein